MQKECFCCESCGQSLEAHFKFGRFNFIKEEKDTGLFIYSVDVTEAHTQTWGDEFSNVEVLMLSLDYGSNEHIALYPVWAEITPKSKVLVTVLFALEYKMKKEGTE